MSDQFRVKWIDGMRNPRCVPDLRYPNGVDLDVSEGKEPACVCKLAYPAKRCGYYYIECTKCHCTAVVTTAGRIDDPKSIKLPCIHGNPEDHPTKFAVAPHV